VSVWNVVPEETYTCVLTAGKFRENSLLVTPSIYRFRANRLPSDNYHLEEKSLPGF